MEEYSKSLTTSNTKINPTAIVEDGAIIGKNSRIWHWTHICPGAQIGENCSLGQNVFIGNDVIIGNNVKIQNNVSVYDSVRLSDDVFCGPSMVFTNVYNPRSSIVRKNDYRPTLVDKGVTFGANCTIICGIQIGKYAFIGAGAVVNKNVQPYSLVLGVPAKHIGWMCLCGTQLKDHGNVSCKCGKKYLIDSKSCKPI